MLLASLDTGVLGAQAAAAQATYAGIAAPPRDVDLASKQTAVASAEATLNNTYNALPSVLADAESRAQTAVYTDADPYFTNLNGADAPRPAFTTNNGTASAQAGADRQVLKTTFDQWNTQLENLSALPQRRCRMAAHSR
jgi:hypothetical protein